MTQRIWKLVAIILLIAFVTAALAQTPVNEVEENDVVLIRVGDETATVGELMTEFIDKYWWHFGEEPSYFFLFDLAVFDRAGVLVSLKEAERRGITVSDGEVEALLARIKAGENVYDIKYPELRDETRLRKYLRELELVSKVVKAVQAEIQVDETLLRAHYESNLESYLTIGKVCLTSLVAKDEEEARMIIQTQGDDVTLDEEVEGYLAAVNESLNHARVADGLREHPGPDVGCFDLAESVITFAFGLFPLEASIGGTLGPIATDQGSVFFGYL